MEKELVLHNINNLFTDFRLVQRRFNRFFSLKILCSIVLIALAHDIISIDQQIRFLDVNFNINLPILLVVGMWAIGILFICSLALRYYADKLSSEISLLYKSLNYEDHSRAVMYL